MVEEYENKREKQVVQMRTITNYGMGIFFFCFGVFFLTYEYFDINLLGRKPSPLDKVIGVLFIVYGVWRLYRGYKKNYFKK
jgi:succinate-acetate transporter protein